MIPVLCALRILITRICHWVQPPVAIETSTDVEKAVSTENQLRGTTHGHFLTTDLTPALNLDGNYGALNSCVNLKQVSQLRVCRSRPMATDYALKVYFRYYCLG
jgi:hypothetical protein